MALNTATAPDRQEVTAMGRPISIIKLTAEEEAELTRRVRTAKTSQLDSERARSWG